MLELETSRAAGELAERKLNPEDGPVTAGVGVEVCGWAPGADFSERNPKLEEGFCSSTASGGFVGGALAELRKEKPEIGFCGLFEGSFTSEYLFSLFVEGACDGFKLIP
mmetsp:Transcript_30154/g.39722  ORF Transcript_30154/g.39722 Transcript_30154/m.39722 type:complete len:109 (-) Transcript_30154:11-337(-)